MAHVPTLGTVSVTAPGKTKEQDAEPAQERGAPGPVLAEDPLVKRVDRVTGALGKDGAHNVFAVYAPHGMDKGPLFHAHVDGRQAAQEPAQQNLLQAESIKQDQVRQQAMEQTQQQSVHQEQGPRMTMGGPRKR